MPRQAGTHNNCAINKSCVSGSRRIPIFPRLGVPRVSSLWPATRAALLARKEIDRTDVQVACDLGLGGSVAKAVEVLRYPRVMQTGRKRELRELGLG